MARTFYFITVCAGLVAFAVDQTAKFFAIGKIPQNGIFLISKNWLTIKLVLTTNADLAFGLSAGRLIKYGLIFITFAIIYSLAAKLLEAKSQPLLIAISILAGAALSNLLDRILRGGVIDFLSISIYNLHWPTFNLADALITITAILLIIKWPRHQPPSIAGSGTGQA